MKIIPVRIVSFFVAVVMATVLSSGVGRACSDLVQGGAASGLAGWSCTLTGEDSQYCYYDCECHGITEAQCYNRLGLAGFELI